VLLRCVRPPKRVVLEAGHDCAGDGTQLIPRIPTVRARAIADEVTVVVVRQGACAPLKVSATRPSISVQQIRGRTQILRNPGRSLSSISGLCPCARDL